MSGAEDSSHGLSAREAEILRLVEDEGRSVQETAAAMGLKLSYVRQVVTMFSMETITRSDRASAAAARASSDALVAAIRATGKSFT